jgi:hypothetical protein
LIDGNVNSDTKVKQSGLSKSMPYTGSVEMNVVSTIVIFSIEAGIAPLFTVEVSEKQSL